METLEETMNEINIDYACRALLGGGKGKSVMEELRKANPDYYVKIMATARQRLEVQGVKLPKLQGMWE